MKARLFLGLALPYPIRRQLLASMGTLAGAKWTAPGNLHLTLVFIGETERDAIERISAAMQNIEAQSFPLALRGMGRFDKRILWAGVNAQALLQDLHHKIETALDNIGVEFDHKPFRPHVTLARLRGSTEPQELEGFMESHTGLKSPTFMVEQFHLYESCSTPQGVHYMPLASFPLGSA